MLQRALVSYDGSASTEAGLGFAARLAEATGARVTAVHVLAPGAEPGLPHSVPDARGWLREAIARAGGADSRIEALVVAERDASTTLVELARRREADLVVAGRTERGGVRRLLKGSTAERLVEFAPCSVLVFPRRPAAGAPARLVVGIDDSDSSRAALREAVPLAAGLSLPLQVVHVVDPHLPFATYGTDRGLRDGLLEQGKELLSGAAEALSGPVEGLSTELREGDPRRELIAVASEQEDTLLVVGHRGSGSVLGVHLGGTAGAIVGHPPCPVLVVRAPRQDRAPD